MVDMGTPRGEIQLRHTWYIVDPSSYTFLAYNDVSYIWTQNPKINIITFFVITDALISSISHTSHSTENLKLPKQSSCLSAIINLKEVISQWKASSYLEGNVSLHFDNFLIKSILTHQRKSVLTVIWHSYRDQNNVKVLFNIWV